MLELKDWVAAIVTLVASFAGAWAAFQFEKRRRDEEEARRNIGAGNRAIFHVYSMWNVLEQYRKEVMEAYRQRADAWLNAPTHVATPVILDRIDTGELQFLLESGQEDVFASFVLEGRRYGLVHALIEARSAMVLNEVFPRMAAAGFPVGASQDRRHVEQVLGIDLCHKLQQTTASIYQNVDEDLASLRALHDDLRNAMKALYPGRKFLKIDFTEGPAAKGQSAASSG